VKPPQLTTSHSSTLRASTSRNGRASYTETRRSPAAIGVELRWVKRAYSPGDSGGIGSSMTNSLNGANAAHSRTAPARFSRP
jgi:hypothetical protein